MKFLLCLVFGLLMLSSVQQAYAQSDYRPGYVVTTSGDTLHGFIDYRWSRSPKQISFRTTAGGAERVYTPLDLHAFSVAGDRYQGAILEIETSPTSLPMMTEVSGPQLKADTAFIREVIYGEKSLYHHYSSGVSGRKLFYILNNGQWELLVYKNFRQVQGENVRVAANNRYISQLASYLQGCPTIRNKMEKLRYQEKNLERLFRSYYQCTDTKPTYENKTKRYLLEAGVVAGGVNTSLDFTSEIFSPLASTSFPSDFTVTGGVFLDIVRRRNDGKWSLNNELLYTSYQTEGTYYIRNTNENNYERSHYLLDYSYLKVNTMIRFKLPVGGFHLFANVGVSNGFMLKGDGRELYESMLYGPQTTEEHTFIKDSQNRYEPGFLVGVGVRYRRYAFETRYEQTTGMMPISFDAFTSKVTKTAFLLSYRFTK